MIGFLILITSEAMLIVMCFWDKPFNELFLCDHPPTPLSWFRRIALLTITGCRTVSVCLQWYFGHINYAANIRNIWQNFHVIIASFIWGRLEYWQSDNIADWNIKVFIFTQGYLLGYITIPCWMPILGLLSSRFPRTSNCILLYIKKKL